MKSLIRAIVTDPSYPRYQSGLNEQLRQELRVPLFRALRSLSIGAEYPYE
jgi:hypothetical protein